MVLKISLLFSIEAVISSQWRNPFHNISDELVLCQVFVHIQRASLATRWFCRAFESLLKDLFEFLAYYFNFERYFSVGLESFKLDSSCSSS